MPKVERKSKISKRTKKFSATKLKNVIHKRKQGQKISRSKQRIEQQPQQLESQHSEEEDRSNSEEGEKEQTFKEAVDGDYFADANFDDNYLAKGEEESEDDEGEDEEGEEEDSETEHKKELESLKETDPEFVKYLEQNDRGLLDFGQDEEDDEEEDDLEAEEGAGKTPQGKKQKKTVLTLEMIEAWRKEIEEKKSLEAMNRLVLAFRAACTMNSEKADSNKSAPSPYEIIDSNVFTKLSVLCLKHMDSMFWHHLQTKKGKQSNVEVPHQSPNWKQIQPIVKTFLQNLLLFLSGLTDSNMQSFVLKSCERLVPFFASFAVLAKKFLKILLQIWCSADETSRLLAFLVIRQLALQMPRPFIELCLKGIYLAYARNVKFTNARNFALITFLSNCVVELYGLDFVASYQHAFVYIRQLAIHLRNTIQTKTKEAFQSVYNWQYLNSLKVWCQLLCTHPGHSELSHLVYPVIQIIIGTIRLVPTPRYYPLRFTCIRMLNELAESTKVFVNVTPYLLEILNSSELKKKATTKARKLPDLMYLIKVSKSGLGTTTFQDKIVSNTFALLLQYFSVYSNTIGFPELALPTILVLKKFNKTCKMPTLKKKMTQLVEQLEQNSSFIVSQRKSLDFGPSAIDRANTFLEGKETNLKKYYNQWKKVEEDKKKSMKLYSGEDDSEQEQSEGEGQPHEGEALSNESEEELDLEEGEEDEDQLEDMDDVDDLSDDSRNEEEVAPHDNKQRKPPTMNGHSQDRAKQQQQRPPQQNSQRQPKKGGSSVGQVKNQKIKNKKNINNNNPRQDIIEDFELSD